MNKNDLLTSTFQAGRDTRVTLQDEHGAEVSSEILSRAHAGLVTHKLVQDGGGAKVVSGSSLPDRLAKADLLSSGSPTAARMAEITSLFNHPILTNQDRHKLLDDLKSDSGPSAMTYFEIDPDRGTVSLLERPHAVETLTRLTRAEMCEILGREVGRCPDGNDDLRDGEASTLGYVLGARDAIRATTMPRHKAMGILKGLRSKIGARAFQAITRLEIKWFDERIKTGETEMHKLQRQLDLKNRQYEAVAELAAWAPTEPRLQRPDGSAFHKLLGAMHAREIVALGVDETIPADLSRSFDAVAHAFVVEHDWAGAFALATNFDAGEVELPYDYTAFEFVVAGRRIIATFQVHDDGLATCVPMLLTKAGWAMPMTYTFEPAGRLTRSIKRAVPQEPLLLALQPTLDLIAANVRAVLISLEAEVAEHHVVRADYRLNAAREKRGKLPLLDYHVVSLARRSRPQPLERGRADPDRVMRNSPRLHFRESHWRYYPEHRTRIAWQLVGDPDLGFIDKHYRL